MDFIKVLLWAAGFVVGWKTFDWIFAKYDEKQQEKNKKIGLGRS